MASWVNSRAGRVVDKRNFIDIYVQVFHPDATMRVCGREMCRKLIKAAEKVRPGLYGDIETGFLNLEGVYALYNDVSEAGYDDELYRFLDVMEQADDADLDVFI